MEGFQCVTNINMENRLKYVYCQYFGVVRPMGWLELTNYRAPFCLVAKRFETACGLYKTFECWLFGKTNCEEAPTAKKTPTSTIGVGMWALEMVWWSLTHWQYIVFSNESRCIVKIVVFKCSGKLMRLYSMGVYCLVYCLVGNLAWIEQHRQPPNKRGWTDPCFEHASTLTCRIQRQRRPHEVLNIFSYCLAWFISFNTRTNILNMDFSCFVKFYVYE